MLFIIVVLSGGAFVAPISVDNLAIYFFILLALSVASVALWRRERSSTADMLGGAVMSVLAGAVFFAIDVLLGQVFHPELPWLDAATRGSGPFGIVVTILICPMFTFIFLSGAARAQFLKWRKSDG